MIRVKPWGLWLWNSTHGFSLQWKKMKSGLQFFGF
ncbi:hypothetical protein Gotri_024416, partial [Gossypium trilobum]|nr:hypothetical protein [Gossypium trilobum]